MIRNREVIQQPMNSGAPCSNSEEKKDCHTDQPCPGKIISQSITLSAEMVMIQIRCQAMQISNSSMSPVLMLVRKQVGNPADYFNKNFVNYKNGFAANGKFHPQYFFIKFLAHHKERAGLAWITFID